MMGRPLQEQRAGLYRYYPLTDAGSQIKGVTGSLESVTARPAVESAPPLPDTRSLRFDGNHGLVELEGQSAILTGGLTLEAWLCPSGAAQGNEVFIALGVARAARRYSCGATTRPIASCCRSAGCQLPTFRFALARTAETWVHLAATVDASNQVVIYTNGARAFAGSLNTFDLCAMVTDLRSRLGMAWTTTSVFGTHDRSSPVESGAHGRRYRRGVQHPAQRDRA